jgi:hypothetical protein
VSRSSHLALHLLLELCGLQLAQAAEPGYVVFASCGYVSIDSGLDAGGGRERIRQSVAVQDELASELKAFDLELFRAHEPN